MNKSNYTPKSRKQIRFKGEEKEGGVFEVSEPKSNTLPSTVKKDDKSSANQKLNNYAVLREDINNIKRCRSKSNILSQNPNNSILRGSVARGIDFGDSRMENTNTLVLDFMNLDET